MFSLILDLYEFFQLTALSQENELKGKIFYVLLFYLKKVAIQLLSKSEKEKFDNLIKIMIAFNINYRQEKGLDGQFTFVLEP